MNKATERYNTKVEIPISVVLETIFNDDNHDVETLTRWAKHYGFVDLVEKNGHKYYQLQNDYKKQSFYIWLSKEERKQYDYEDYLIDENERLHSLYEERCRKIKDYLKLIREDNQKGILCSYNLIEDNITRLCDGLDILGSDKE